MGSVPRINCLLIIVPLLYIFPFSLKRKGEKNKGLIIQSDINLIFTNGLLREYDKLNKGVPLVVKFPFGDYLLL